MAQLSNLRLLFSSFSLAKPSTLHFRSLFSTVIASSSSSSPKRHRNAPLHLTRRNKSNSRGGRGRTTRPMELQLEEENKNAGFNKKRAEGRDRNDAPKNLQLKLRKLNPVNTIAYLQILGTGMDTQDTSPSVLLFFDKQRFIFNAGEGLQRFCTEHKIRLSKIDHIFLSRVCSETSGGLPGLLLTLAGIGEEGMSVKIWGPSDLKYLVDAMQSFIPSAAMVHTKSFGGTDETTVLAGCKQLDSPIVLVDDEVVKISAIILQPHRIEGQALSPSEALNSSNGKNQPAAKPGDMSVVYICELPEINGKFDPDKAKALGLRPGPKYRQLQLGNPVQSDRQNVTIHPSDVMGPSVPGPIVLLVDCPTESHLESLLSVQSLTNYYDQEGGKSVTCVIHLSPASVVSCSGYQKWMKKFGSAQHIMAGHEKKNVDIPILKASARIASRLNYVCPQFFPAPGFLSHSDDDFSELGALASSENSFSESSKVISAENLLKFTLRPYAHLGLDRSCTPTTVASTQIIDDLLSEIPEVVEAAHHGVPHEPVLVVGPRQLKRYLDAYQRLEELDMLFLDCKHTTEASLDAFEHSSDPKNNNREVPASKVDSTLFARGSRMQSLWKRPGSPVDKDALYPILERFMGVIQEAGLKSLISFPVVHCPQAFGVVLNAAERTSTSGKVIPGWKVVYSGDTRPCPGLIEASRGATVLIHEATFEEAMVEEAIAKNHSTTSEAIEMGNSAEVYRIILTHFSQRYPKIPVLDEAHMHKTCVAFDMMSVNVADLPVLPKVLPYLKMLFRNEMIVDESDDVVDAVSSAY
ncbi:hypothetical protein PIB30_049775 [Stylosanthes scabra]|uniref:ribonuclease Z n=1 Tax=Stylosanthes scabra TaxID=79078 RepID=A0ABU6YG97_9FABA|nr:hypothetical protein [Stylosanthes scabra]